MRLRDATPAGYTRGPAFVTHTRGCTLADIRIPSFSVGTEARVLAELRLELGIGLHDAASKIGVRAVDLSGLEHGRLVPCDPQDWPKIRAALRR